MVPRGWFKVACRVLMGALLCVLPGVSRSWALTAEEQNSIQVYRKAAPGVVHIRSTVVRYGFFFQPLPSQGTGSGVVLDREGHIVTNAHVIQDARAIEVTLSDGSQYPARLVGSQPDKDLAVIRIEGPAAALQPIPRGNARDLRVGQTVLAIGNPFGLQQTLTKGVISSLNRTLATPEGGRLEGLIQTDAAINPGNSGGPMLDREGRLIGINTAIISPSGGSVGVGFAIPIDVLERHLPRLVRGGEIPWLSVLLALAGIGILFWLWRSRSRRGPIW
jgi:putative serine protease PepD